MDFEKIVEILPFGVMIWRAESNNPADFRLVYANTQASRDFEMELFDYIGKQIKEIFPDALAASESKNLPKMWMKVVKTGEDKTITLSFNNKTVWYEIHMLSLGKRNVASVFKNVTSEKHAQIKAEKAIRALKVLEADLNDFKKRRSGEHKFDYNIKKSV